MSNHSLRARGTDLPFSHKSVISIAHEQNIICSKKLICSQLFAGRVVGSRPMKRKDKIHRMIINVIRQFNAADIYIDSIQSSVESNKTNIVKFIPNPKIYVQSP